MRLRNKKTGKVYYVSSGDSLTCIRLCLTPIGNTSQDDVILVSLADLNEDWEDYPAPERDSKTKCAFMEYISDHRDERFFQAVRNFAGEYLGDDFNFIYASKKPLEDYVQHYDKFQDTFYFECDRIHELEEAE